MICLFLIFALKNILVLLAKHDSGELCCPATALIKKFFTVKKSWDGLPVFMPETIYHVHTEMRQSLASLFSCMSRPVRVLPTNTWSQTPEDRFSHHEAH